ncbi:MAG: ferritin-like domain-containing protein [Acidimicrobiales bacterium]
MKEFLTDVESLRTTVLEEIDREPNGVGRGHERAIFVLNQALALNMVCVIRHMRHFVTADRFDARSVAQEFLEHTVRESEHSDLIVARIRELGGEPAYERNAEPGHGHFECDSLSEFEEILREDLLAEQVAAAAYAEMIWWLADADPTSSQMLDQIRALEEEHAEVMLNFVAMIVN